MAKQKSKKSVVCPTCEKTFGSPAALRSHRLSVHGEANPMALNRGDEITFNVSLPMVPHGVHTINCPLCASVTALTMDKDGKASVGKPSSIRPSSSRAEKNTYPHYVREHPIIIRKRMSFRYTIDGDLLDDKRDILRTIGSGFRSPKCLKFTCSDTLRMFRIA